MAIITIMLRTVTVQRKERILAATGIDLDPRPITKLMERNADI